MWSRKPTPVSRVPAPLPSSASVSLTSVSPVLRSIVAVRVGSSLLNSRRTRASIDSACTSKPSARAIGAPAAASFSAAVADPHLGHPAPEVARREHRGEARRAAGRQHVVGAGDVVAERGRARGADEQAAGAAHQRRERLDLRADQLQVLGRERVRELERLARVGDLDERERGVADRRALDDERVELRGERVADARAAARPRRRGCPRRARPGRACRARRVRSSRSADVRAERDQQVARAGEAVDADDRPRAGAWPPARRGCPGPTITSTRSTVSVP